MIYYYLEVDRMLPRWQSLWQSMIGVFCKIYCNLAMMVLL